MKKDKLKLVKPSHGSYRLNQTAQIFKDRRTKRNRTRSTQNRNEIERSLENGNT